MKNEDIAESFFLSGQGATAQEALYDLKEDYLLETIWINPLYFKHELIMEKLPLHEAPQAYAESLLSKDEEEYCDPTRYKVGCIQLTNNRFLFFGKWIKK